MSMFFYKENNDDFLYKENDDEYVFYKENVGVFL